MEEQLDALIVQNEKNNKEVNDNLEALIVQNKNNNTQPEIEALIVQNKNLTKTVKSGRDKIVEAVKELKTEPVIAEDGVLKIVIPKAPKELSISNPDDISKAVVERLGEFESTIKEYFVQKLAVEKEKDSKRSKHTADKEKSLGELKNGIIKAIESLSKNIPKSLDYSDTLKSILSELENKEVNLSIVEKGLKTISDEVKKILPDKLIDDDRVKVVLSDEQIKKLLDGLNIQVTNSSSEYAVNVNGTRINRATIEKQDEIKGEIQTSNSTLQDIKVSLEEPLPEWVSSNIDTEDATNYYFLSFIPGTTKWRINRLNKTSYVSDYAIGDSDIETAWTDRASQTYAIIY